MVEVILSIAAVTAGPLLAPPIWALFSKRLTGKASFLISVITLCINLVFKLFLPYAANFKLNRAEEMMVGVGFPFLLLMINEILQRSKLKESEDYKKYNLTRLTLKSEESGVDNDEAYAIKKQNHFGLRVIAFSLLFTAIMMFVLSIVTERENFLTALIGFIILIAAIIPAMAAKRSKKKLIQSESLLQNKIKESGEVV
jgi:MFS family permease